MRSPRKQLEELLRSKEGQKLEFKSAAAVDDELILPRSVCSFLNAGGGTILVGVRDDGSVEGVADPEGAKRRVEDRVVSTVSPHASVNVEVENHASSGRSVLRITVPRGAHETLYAVSSTRGRLLLPVRQADRTINLGWLEILRRLGTKGDREVAEEADGEIRKYLQGWVKNCESASPTLVERGGLYLVLSGELESKNPDLKHQLEAALIDPSTLGVDPGHVSFSDLRGEVRLRREALESGSAEDGYRYLVVTTGKDWNLRFATRLDETWAWGQSLAEKRSSRLIHPYALSQTISSCVVLGRALFHEHAAAGSSIHGALELRRVRGRTIPPGAPRLHGYVEMPNWPKLNEDPGPSSQSVKVEDFAERPHEIAKLLLDDLYRSFGWDASKVPFFDAARARFDYR